MQQAPGEKPVRREKDTLDEGWHASHQACSAAFQDKRASSTPRTAGNAETGGDWQQIRQPGRGQLGKVRPATFISLYARCRLQLEGTLETTAHQCGTGVEKGAIKISKLTSERPSWNKGKWTQVSCHRLPTCLLRHIPRMNLTCSAR